MNSLIMKDLISLKSYGKTLAIILAFFTVMTYANNQPSFLSGMIILLMSMLPITSFSYDHHAKWDLFSQTLPVSRKQSVMSKYVLGILTVGTGAILATVLNIGVALVKSIEIDAVEYIIANGLISLVAFVFLSILIPLVYHFGVEKSRMLMILVMTIPTLIVIALTKAGVVLPNIDHISPTLIFAIGVVIVVFIMFISFAISVRFYQKKDF